jgi:hypothetical protein
MDNKLRFGNFTSSSISALMSLSKDKKDFGKPAITYIKEKLMERKLKRVLNTEMSARPTLWGKVVEQRAFDVLGMEYKLTSKVSYVHPEFNFWVGTPDGLKENTVYDIKCPYTLKSFCEFAECKTIEDVREFHKSGEDYYWQLVSNSILTGMKFAELIVYCPKQSELDEIRKLTENIDDGVQQTKVQWIYFAEDEDLPYIPEDSEYNNIYVIPFEVPESDKILLTDAVKRAGKYLM